jgi:hypothetical protein
MSLKRNRRNGKILEMKDEQAQNKMIPKLNDCPLGSLKTTSSDGLAGSSCGDLMG